MRIVTAMVLTASILAGYNGAVAEENCSALQDPQTRLACFDKSAQKATTAKKSAGSKDTKAALPRAAATDGGWELRITKDNFTDKTSCVISPTGRPWVQINVGNLYISYAGRGGVAGFTLRVDDHPPGQMQLPTPIDKQIGAVHLSGDKFFDAMAGNRLRVQTFTVLRELKDEDLDLAPVKRLYKKMGPECEQRQ